MVYLLVAYKPESTEYARGCSVGGYSSDFEYANHLSEDALIKEWSRFLLMDLEKGYQECDHDILIFKDGIQVWEPYGFTYDLYELASEEETEEARKLMYGLKDKALKLAQENYEVRKEKARLAAIQEEVDRQNKAKLERKRIFEKLKTEFGE